MPVRRKGLREKIGSMQVSNRKACNYNRTEFACLKYSVSNLFLISIFIFTVPSMTPIVASTTPTAIAITDATTKNVTGTVSTAIENRRR